MRCHRGPDHEANIRKHFKPGDVKTELRIAADHKLDRAGWWNCHPNKQQLDETGVARTEPHFEESEEPTESYWVDPESGPEERTFILQMKALTGRLVVRLPERQGRAIELLADGATAAEIAAELGCTEKAAERLVEKGREKLRASIGDERYEDLMKALT
jgi:DNA-directed RNA polymerase specialized sigma24 family protein